MTKKRLEERIGLLLCKKRLTLSLAESCTGGLISSRITDISGSSEYYLGGIVSYSNEVKSGVLGVPGSMIKKYGAVSAEVAKAMAIGVRKKLGSDVAAAITGIAGPGGGTLKKPVGLCYFSVITPKGQWVDKVHVSGSRRLVKSGFAEAVLTTLEKKIKL
ncbi:MAG TPA: CinA family protein [Candidatus Omnitrophota bacterium]|nr:CinA family protein [Candidatus Omnitrophota bacterium]